MPTKKIAVVTAAPTPAAVDVDAPEVQEAEYDELQGLLSSLAGASSAKVTVYRAERNKPLAYIFECAPEAFSLDELRDKYNGGDFRLFISRNGVLWKNRPVSVEPKNRQPEAAPPSDAAAIAAAMRDGFARQAEVLRTALARPQHEAPSLLSGIDLPATITAIAAAVTALRPAAPPPPPPPAESPSQAINLFLKGFEMARELKGDSSDEPSLMGLLGGLIKSPALVHAVQLAASQARPPAAPRPPAPPKPAPALPAPPPPTVEEVSQVKPDPLFSHYLALLVQKAADGSDPMLYADLILDSMEAETLEALLQRQPSAVGALIVDHPPVAAHREWFQALVDGITAALAQSDEPDEAGEGSTHAAGNAAPIVPGQSPAG